MARALAEAVRLRRHLSRPAKNDAQFCYEAGEDHEVRSKEIAVREIPATFLPSVSAIQIEQLLLGERSVDAAK